MDGNLIVGNGETIDKVDSGGLKAETPKALSRLVAGCKATLLAAAVAVSAPACAQDKQAGPAEATLVSAKLDGKPPVIVASNEAADDFDALFAAESEETQAEIAAIDERIAATDERIAATDERIAATDERIAANKAEIAANREEIAANWKAAADAAESAVDDSTK